MVSLGDGIDSWGERMGRGDRIDCPEGIVAVISDGPRRRPPSRCSGMPGLLLLRCLFDIAESDLPYCRGSTGGSGLR